MLQLIPLQAAGQASSGWSSIIMIVLLIACLLYTSDAADD